MAGGVREYPNFVDQGRITPESILSGPLLIDGVSRSAARLMLRVRPVGLAERISQRFCQSAHVRASARSTRGLQSGSVAPAGQADHEVLWSTCPGCNFFTVLL